MFPKEAITGFASVMSGVKLSRILKRVCFARTAALQNEALLQVRQQRERRSDSILRNVACGLPLAAICEIELCGENDADVSERAAA